MIYLLRILCAPLLWLASFSAVYGLQGMGCERGWENVLREILLLAWAVMLLLQIVIFLLLQRVRPGSEQVTLRKVSLATSGAGVLATVWLLPALILTSTCSLS